MGRWDKAFQEQVDKIQAEVPEPVLALGVLQPAGSWGAMGLGHLSGAASMIRQHEANKNAGPLSGRRGIKANRTTFMALTADKLYAFDTKPSMRTRQNEIVGKLAEWNRSDVRVELKPGRMSTKVVFDHADGSHSELEATTVTGYNDPFLAELGSMAAA